MSSSVLYDVPGPTARARNAVFSVVTIIVVIALLGFVVYRLAVTGQFDAQKWSAFAYATIWTQILRALWATLSAFLVAGFGAVLLGFLLAVARLSDHAWIRWPATWIVEVLRAVPVLIMMMLLYYGLPYLGVRMEPFFAVVIGLIAYNGSVLAEVFRSGVQALPRGQREAGYAIGLRKSGVLMSVLMPQAVRAMLPVIIAQLVVTLKDTALGFIITYNELLYFARLLGTQNELGRPIIPVTIVVGAIYILVCVLLSWLAVVVQRRVSTSSRIAGGATAAQANVDGATTTELIGTQQADVPGGDRAGVGATAGVGGSVASRGGGDAGGGGGSGGGSGSGSGGISGDGDAGKPDAGDPDATGNSDRGGRGGGPAGGTANT
ncbi:amino acid ABC transporter permease [Pseudoclavibacter endophyticus]|uniref:amino acid ABC transporter permease n=1 Tax=Pseudoclavibacter endophyticus TaxID=1778590 RepID=UPI0016629088|nr:amino acid ABC transporter permease [Pseudoclavibacter endophyticus]GGA74212.1 amino acid ABC transporter permease [Pseudoclavibacter endophyticus]